MSNNITVIGNVTKDPGLKFLPNGSAATEFSVADNRRWTDSEGTIHEEVSFFDVVAYGDLAENLSQSIARGHRVIVVGRLNQRSWENQAGEKRSKVELVADAVGPDTRWAIAKVTKVERQKEAAAS